MTPYSRAAAQQDPPRSHCPIERNDWEYFGGLGLPYKPSTRWQLTADVLDHPGWNELPGLEDRDFDRLVLSISAALTLQPRIPAAVRFRAPARAKR